MSFNSFSSNQGTQTNLLTDNTGGPAGTLIPVMKLDYSPQGTAGTLFTGTILGVNNIGTLPNIPGGTITLSNPAGTFNNIATGTIQTLGTVGTIQQLNNIGTLPNLPQGSITVTLGTVIGTVTTNQATGTMNLGTIVGKDVNAATQTGNPIPIGGTDSGGTVRTALVNASGAWNIGTLNNGTVVIPSGTINVGTFNMASGTLNLGTVNMSSGTLNLGTVNMTTGTVNVGTFVNNGGTVAVVQNAGTLQAGANTIGNIGSLLSGTINVGTFVMASGTLNVGTAVMPSGTLNVGTINIGTFQQNFLPTAAMPTYGTHGTTGVSVFGTLVGGTGSGAGTEIFLTSLSFSIPSTGGSQDISIGWGTNGGTFHSGTGRIVRGNFPAGAGIQKTFNPAINSGTNAQLCYFQAGAGTVDIDITYFTTTSTL